VLINIPRIGSYFGHDPYHHFMQLQAKISRDKLKYKIGSTQTVLIDEIKDDRVIARSKSDAPEIDGQVFIPQAPGLKIGTFAQVKNR